MKTTRRIIGQVLLAFGVTQAIGGTASFVVENVELRFIGNVIADDAGRMLWIIAGVLLACAGFFLWRSSRTNDNAV